MVDSESPTCTCAFACCSLGERAGRGKLCFQRRLFAPFFLKKCFGLRTRSRNTISKTILYRYS